MELSTSVEIRPNPEQLGLLRGLLVELAEGFKELARGQVDEDSHRRGFEQLRTNLEDFRGDFQERVQYFKEVESSLGSRDERQSFLEAVGENEVLREELRMHLTESKQRIKMVEPITENVFKITSMRGLLGRITNGLAKRTIAQALTNASVQVDRIRESRTDLQDVLKELENMGLDSAVDAPAMTAVDLPEATPRPGSDYFTGSLVDAARQETAREEKKKKADRAKSGLNDDVTLSRLPGMRDSAIGSAPTADNPIDDAVTAANEGAAAVELDAEPKKKKTVTSAEFNKVRTALNRWSRWYPLAPPRLGNVIGVITACKERCIKLNVVALWGSRTRSDVSVPYQGNSVNESHIDSLWSLPATPPRDFEPGREEARQVPGDESIVECDLCAKSGNESCSVCNGKGRVACIHCRDSDSSESCEHCDNGMVRCGCTKDKDESTCEACKGTGKLFRYQVCETQYSKTELWETDFNGQLPVHLLKDVQGQSTYETHTAVAGETVEPDLEKTCIAAIANHVSKNFMRDTVEPFFRGPEVSREGASSEGVPEVRLVRSRVELFKIPVIRMICGFKDSGHPNALSQFRAWVYGKQGRLHFDALPRAWTTKASVWMVVLIAAGASAGFVVGRVVQSMLGG